MCFLFAPSLAGLHPPVVLHTAAPQEGSALCLGVAQEPQREAGGHGVARPKTERGAGNHCLFSSIFGHAKNQLPLKLL